jgi:regulator of sirC expression with transglutaminase-like and TPR domain
MIRRAALDFLRHVGQSADADIDLAKTALALASLDCPTANLTPYEAHVQAMVDDLAAHVGGRDLGALPQIEALRAVMVGRYGYHGDQETYEDLQNANLIKVIDRRRGLPVALGILALHLARSQGWLMHGLSFPGHFLLRLDHGGTRQILDPFADLILHDAASLRALLRQVEGHDAQLIMSHYDVVSNRDILLRLQNNIKLRHLREERHNEAAEIVANMLLFYPDQPGLLRESGLLNAHLGRIAQAIAAFERLLHIGPAAGVPSGLLQQTSGLLQQLRERST